MIFSEKERFIRIHELVKKRLNNVSFIQAEMKLQKIKLDEKIEHHNGVEIKGLSQKEVKTIAWLEFYQKYFFDYDDIKQFFVSKSILYNFIKRLVKKKRIIKINKNKYYLIPIKAKSGAWIPHEFIIIDEICNSGDYYIGGWTSANYWKLTDQIPSTIEAFTTKKQGKINILNTKIYFHRIRNIDKSKYVIKKIAGHEFKILNKKESKKWLKSRESLI